MDWWNVEGTQPLTDRKEETQMKRMGWCLREWLAKEKEGNGNIG